MRREVDPRLVGLGDVRKGARQVRLERIRPAVQGGRGRQDAADADPAALLLRLRICLDRSHDEAGSRRQGQAPIQEYPYDSVLPDWSAWVGKIAERYRGRITAYEVWNEPTMGGAPPAC